MSHVRTNVSLRSFTGCDLLHLHEALLLFGHDLQRTNKGCPEAFGEYLHHYSEKMIFHVAALPAGMFCVLLHPCAVSGLSRPMTSVNIAMKIPSLVMSDFSNFVVP
jgi:hypothetical protein